MSLPAATHTHEWRAVPAVIVTIADPFVDAKGGETYNAECACGARAWLHGSFGRHLPARRFVGDRLHEHRATR